MEYVLIVLTLLALAAALGAVVNYRALEASERRNTLLRNDLKAAVRPERMPYSIGASPYTEGYEAGWNDAVDNL